MIQHNVAHWQPEQQAQQQNIPNTNVQQQQLSGLSVVSDQNANQNHAAVAPPPPAQFFNHAAYQQQRPVKTTEPVFAAFQPTTTNDVNNYNNNNNNIYQNQQQHQGLAQNFFDHSQDNNNNNNNINNNSNQNNSKNDGWGDWGEWNDNNNAVDQQPYFNSTSQPVESTASVISDSFNSSDNSNWNWNMLGTNEQNNYNNALSQSFIAPNPTTTTTTSVNANNMLIAPSQPQLAQPQQQQQPQTQTISSKQGGHVIPVASMDMGNENFNSMPSIPTSPVYVSQAKPVTMPSRQFASPPAVEVAPLSEQIFVPPPPPEGFQNDPPKMMVASRMQPPPLPPVASVAVGQTNANPFKRAGSSQHHVANFIPTAPNNTANSILPPLVDTKSQSGNAFFVAPPPPAGVTALIPNFEQPENSEVLHENQEVLAQNSLLSGDNNNVIQQPLNAERNQYLQTSHLSENSMEETNVEGDNLPPPGLSRLVLGQPEYRANQQQRMVTGTEDTLEHLSNINRGLEERQADGEDNSSINRIMHMTTTSSSTAPAVAVNPTQPTSVVASAGINMQMTADRNLYTVPGQSNGNNDQLPRVITGFDNDEQIVTLSTQQTPPPPLKQQQQQHISGQREIDLDGENLEDQQQSQLNLPLNQQQINVNVSTGNRNEPPLEGAVAQVAPTQLAPPTSTITTNANLVAEAKEIALDQQHTNNSVSTVNMESDPDQYKKQHGTTNSRKHVGTSDENINHMTNKRKDIKEQEKKHSSVGRYESDESADEEYSSDRERSRYKRNYREGSVRSDRERDRGRDRDESDKQYHQKERRRREGGENDKQTRDKYYRGDMESGNDARTERRSKRYPRYDQDSSHEDGSSRKDQTLNRRSTRDNRDRERDRRAVDRADRAGDYDDFNRRYRNSKRVVDREEEQAASRHRRDRDRDRVRERDNNSDTMERRRRRAGGPDKNKSSSHNATRPLDIEREEYEEYRKQSSRNARESDVEKDRGGASSRYDPRYAAMYGYNHHGQGAPGTYGAAYDPYAYYYEHMARFNPQAYTEMYKKYYGAHSTASAGDVSATSVGLGGTGATATTAGSDHLTGDGRESVHSGRSSVQHDHERYTQAYVTQAHEYHRHFQQQHQQQHLQQHNVSVNYQNIRYHDMPSYRNGNNGAHMRNAHSSSNLSLTHSELSRSCMPLDGNAYYASALAGDRSIQRARSEYADSRSGGDADAMADQQRMTPCKFVNEHAVATLSAGLLLTVKPKYTSHGHSHANIVKVQRVAVNDATRQLMLAFPGPLVRGQTHKKPIIEFCEEQIRQGPQPTTIYAGQLLQLNDTHNQRFKPSYCLMWNLLILLLRQNGMVVGTDIAELLLKNQREFPYFVQEALAEEEDEDEDDNDNDNDDDLNRNLADANDAEKDNEIDLKVEDPSSGLTEVEVTDKFRQYLLYGNVNEALDWATDNNLWGHALFLASKMDRRTHANVMMKFANKLSLNDPLQTLYQLMSGRAPSSVTSLQDDKWGDWRPHLSMILSNTSQKPELDRKAITTMGDSLFHQGDLYAAHFCYLMAQVGFGRYDHSATYETTLVQHLPKLVLLGSSHYKQFRDFASNDAIIMTEIYEYACSLNDDKFSLVEYQPYKYLYATRLLDYGQHLKCFMYMEQIAAHIERDASKYDTSFIKKVFELADRLKYYDPLLDKMINDDERETNDEVLNGSLPNYEEQKWMQYLRSLVIEPQLETSSVPPIVDGGNGIDQQFMEINRQFNELNMQYVATDTQQQQQQPQPEPSPLDQQQQQQFQQAAMNVNNFEAQQQLQQQPLASQIIQEQPLQQQALPAFYDPTQQAYNYTQDPQMGVNLNDGQNQNAQYDYWAQQQQQQTQQPQQQQPSYMNDENPRPTISLPKTKSYDSEDEQREMSTNQRQSSTNDAKNTQKSKNLNNKNDAKDNLMKSTQGSQNSGWFGGIWNKLSLKPKNQMILPDDKNPSIVWDAKKKQWVNTDGGDETTEETFKPPPRMTDLMPQQIQQQQPLQSLQQPQPQPPPFSQVPQQQQQNTYETTTGIIASANLAATKTPTLQSNKFKMQRNRTLKNSYVDVFNPSGAPMTNAADSIMAPAMPAATAPQASFFNPNEPLQQQQEQNVPQFYNPNQYGNNAGFN